MGKRTRRTRRTRRTKRSQVLAMGEPTVAASKQVEPESAPVRMYTSAPSGRTPMLSSRLSRASSSEISRRVIPSETVVPVSTPGGSRVETALWIIVFISAILSVVSLRSNRTELVTKSPEGTGTGERAPGAGPGLPRAGSSSTPARPPNRTFAQAGVKPGAPGKSTANRAGARTGAWKNHRTIQRKKIQPHASTFTGNPRPPVRAPPLGAVGDEVTVSGIVTARLSEGALVRVSGRSILVKGPDAAALRVGADFRGRGSLIEPMGDLQVLQIEVAP